MQQNRDYTIRYSRLKRASLYGFELSYDKVSLQKDMDVHFMVLPMLNSAKKGYSWGRFHLKAELPKECELHIWAFAMDLEDAEKLRKASQLNEKLFDSSVSVREKRDVFERSEGIYRRNQTDILLYELQGQYLWLAIEVTGGDIGTIKELYLHNPGDNFMQTFPEVYQEEGGFFHRYLSIFSSMYADIQKEMDEVCTYFDAEAAPAEMLPVLAGWFGMKVERDFPDEAVLRRLLKEVYQLNKMKGTRWALERLAEIVLGEEIQIIEKNLLDAKETDEQEIYEKLYGESRWDVTVLVNRAPEKKLQEQFLYLASQFMPVRCRLHLVFHQNCNGLDSYCFLDQNAKLLQNSYGSLGQGDIMDGSIILK